MNVELQGNVARPDYMYKILTLCIRLNLEGEAWAEIVNKQPLNSALLYKVGQIN